MNIVRSSSRRKPDRIFLYGVEGIGKSSFAANADKPLFLDLEDGLAHLDVPCIPIKTFKDFTLALASIPAEFKTIVIDTADALEALIWADLCQRNGWKSIEDPAYGKGYVAATDAWRPVLTTLDGLREKGFEVIVLAHTATRNFANPAGPDYCRYEPKLDKRASALLKEWSDAILFACHDDTASVRQNEQKAKAAGTGKRILHTTHAPAWDAKNRFGLPDPLALDYATFSIERAKFRSAAPAQPESAQVTAATPTVPPASKPAPVPAPKAQTAGGTKTPAPAKPSASGQGPSVEMLRALASKASVAVGADKVGEAIKAITGGKIANAKPEQHAAIAEKLKELINAAASAKA